MNEHYIIKKKESDLFLKQRGIFTKDEQQAKRYESIEDILLDVGTDYLKYEFQKVCKYLFPEI